MYLETTKGLNLSFTERILNDETKLIFWLHTKKRFIEYLAGEKSSHFFEKISHSLGSPDKIVLSEDGKNKHRVFTKGERYRESERKMEERDR